MSAAKAVSSVSESLKKGLRALVPLLVLAVYTLIGAVLFMQLEGPNEAYELEKLSEERSALLENTAYRLNVLKGLTPVQAYNHTIKTLNRFQEKLGIAPVNLEDIHWSISGSIFYCMTVYTTIGYGNIVPVTTSGRVLTIVYAFIGIPIAVICLYSLGQLFARLCRLVWKAILKSTAVVSKDLEKKVSELGESAPLKGDSSSGNGSGENPDDLLSFPISILLLIAIIWILLSAAIFLIFEDDWDYGTSLYFTLISFTTIGFGDVLPSKYDYMIIVGILVIFGLSLVSTVMSLIQQQIEALTDNMQADIDAQYVAALAEAQDEGEIDEKAAEAALEAAEGDQEVDVEAHKAALDPRSLSAVVSRMPMKSRVLFHIMPASSKKALEKRNESRLATRSRHCQTDYSLLQSLLEEFELKKRLATSPQAIHSALQKSTESPQRDKEDTEEEGNGTWPSSGATSFHYVPNN